MINVKSSFSRLRFQCKVSVAKFLRFEKRSRSSVFGTDSVEWTECLAAEIKQHFQISSAPAE